MARRSTAVPSSVAEMTRAVRRAGYEVVKTKRHNKIYRADGTFVSPFPSTPGDQNSLKASWRDFQNRRHSAPRTA